MKQKTINRILRETEKGYDLISEKFSQTRNNFWRELMFVKKYVNYGDKVLDYGCGNGRLLNILEDKKIYYYGIDISQKLIDLAQKKYASERVIFKKIKPDEKNIPFLDNYFDVIYVIASLHHIPGKQHRDDIVRDFYRILKPNGYIVVTVWNLWQKKYRKNILKNRLNIILKRSELEWNDCLINFRDNKGNLFKRYHHAFKKNELKNVFKRSGFGAVEVGKTGGNIFFIGKKLADVQKSSIIPLQRLRFKFNNIKK